MVTGVLVGFRTELYSCLTARADELFELADASLCTDGPVKTLVDLALAPEHRRGHGALYDGLNCGRIEIAQMRRALADLPLPRTADGRIVLAVDVSPWLRPDAATSAERLFCHVHGRSDIDLRGMHLLPLEQIVGLKPGQTVTWIRTHSGVEIGLVRR
ncbi:MAG: hypothetical protein JWN00_2781 [Actinomycetia bacterium]|nr:hypothetical protein [Actinomycetes bacterium]